MFIETEEELNEYDSLELNKLINQIHNEIEKYEDYLELVAKVLKTKEEDDI